MIPILCDETKTLPAILADKSNGIGRLDCLTAKVYEVANGQYTAEMTYPVDGEHFKDIRLGGIVKMKPNELSDVQMFRISKISKPLNKVITISSNHISYDLSKTSVLPFSATGALATLNGIKNHIVSGDSYPFTYETDITNNTSQFTLTTPQSVRACLGGVQGSFLDVFGFVQFEWDNLTVKALRYRGTDRNARIAYGKNITDIKQEENLESMYTAVQPYVVVDDNAIMGDLQTIIKATYPKVLNLDLTSEFDSGGEITKTMINNRCKQYIEDNDLATPNISIDVQFVPLWQTEEYKEIAPLERVGLFDTVTVSFSPLGIDVKAKVTEYTYNVLEERYETIHLGDIKSTLGSTINQIINESIVKNDNSNFVSTMTNVILNSLGLFSTKVLKANGGYQYYLHNKPNLADSQYQWTINAGGFAVSQDYGQTWNAGITVEGDAVFNSIWTAKLIANQIVAGILQDQKGTNYWNMETGEFSLSSNTTVGGSTVKEIADSSASGAVTEFVNGVYKTDKESFQNQIDGNITTWYYPHEPTLNNVPTNGWDNTAKENHVGDLFFNQNNGYVYRFQKDGTTYKWQHISDSDIANALSAANSAQDTADHKRRVFTSTPTPPYDVGDLYFGGTTSDILTCTTAKASGSYVSSDWSKLNKYTDDSAVDALDDSLNQQNVFNRLTNNGQTQGIYLKDGKVYINASYIATGTLSANYIKGGTLKLGGANNGNGQLQILDASNNQVGLWNNGGISITKGSINLGSGVFQVSNAGALTASNATINGSLKAQRGTGYYVNISSGAIYAGYGSTQYGYIDASATVTTDLGTYQGIKMGGNALYIDTPNISCQGYTGHTGQLQLIVGMQFNGGNSYTWWKKIINFRGGLLVTDTDDTVGLGE